MENLIVFASGTGTNTQAIIDHFRHSGEVKVALIVCNRPDAGVLHIAEKEGIPYLLVDRSSFNGPDFPAALAAYRPSLIVLAGFLWKISSEVVNAFPGKIINIHPALLPSFGGKGMYGARVHEAVIGSRARVSGITIHYVNEHYDEGDIILQAHCPVRPGDTPDTLATRIHQLEHFYFPRAIEYLVLRNHQ